MFDLSKLRNEHTELLAVVDRLGVVCARDAPPPLPELDTLRRELQTKLLAHLQAEDWMLYPSLLDSIDPGVVQTARNFSSEMGGLAASFLNYVEKWNTKAIAGSWRAYCADTAEITAALVTRIKLEDECLYPVLDPVARAA